MAAEERAEAGRRLAGFRVRTPKACAECGREFQAFGRQKYCTHACKLRAWRKRDRAPRREAAKHE